jgi:hypothetical protein
MDEIRAIGSSEDLSQCHYIETAMEFSALVALRHALDTYKRLDKSGIAYASPDKLKIEITFAVEKWDLQAKLRMFDTELHEDFIA